MASDCHIIEIDLLRRGPHVLCVPECRVQEIKPYDYLVCVNRFPKRNRFELYPHRLRDRLPIVKIPLGEGDADVSLDIQQALAQVFWDGRYFLLVRYDEPCEPPLREEDQERARERWRQFQNSESRGQ